MILLQVLFGQFFFQIPKRLTNDRLDLVHADILSKETVEVLDGDGTARDRGPLYPSALVSFPTI